MLGEVKVNMVSPRDVASRSASWRKEEAAYRSKLGVTIMKTSSLHLIGYTGWALRDS